MLNPSATVVMHQWEDADTQPTGVPKTPFELRFAELKAAKEVARSAQATVARVENELAAKQKEVAAAQQDLKRARKAVDAAKEGLAELFSDEMRNY